MSEQRNKMFTYRILRYAPNLIRDEWVNIGVLLYDPRRKRLEARVLEEDSDLARVRKLHPQADIELLRTLPREFESRIREASGDPDGFIHKLEDTLSNTVQLSSAKGLVAADFAAEMDRVYEEQVTSPRQRKMVPGRTGPTRNRIRSWINQAFRRNNIDDNQIKKSVPVAEFTHAGDPMKLDFRYGSNGTRGFVHALALSRDPGQAKVLAYTAEKIRAQLAGAEFTGVTEMEVRPDNEKHQFVAGLLREQQIQLIPITRVDEFARDLASRLR